MDRICAVQKDPREDRHGERQHEQSDRDSRATSARLPNTLASTEYAPAPVNSSVVAPMNSKNGTLNGSDQKAPCETLTAHAQIIAPTTAHAASGVRIPRTSPIPPSVSATVTIRAAIVGRLQPPASMKPAVVLKSKALMQPGLDHRGTDADAKDQQAEVGG